MSLVANALDSLRRADRALGQRRGRRRVLVDARTPVNFTMVAPVYRAMSADPRVSFFFTASEEPDRLREIYREAPDVQLIDTAAARRMRFDAYVASDFMWQPLPRGTCRVQVFHGVGGKYGFDAPTESMRAWDRIFFVNERRLRNFIKAGAIDADSPAIRMVGLPKADALVNGTWTRAAVLEPLGLDPAKQTVLYAPTWSPASSLNAIGLELIDRIKAMGVNLIVKLHDRSRDIRARYSGGIDWVEALTPRLQPPAAALAPGHDITPYLVAADLMVTDHSSAGFEYLLRDRPIVRIHRPELIRDANIHPDYVELLASVSASADGVDEAVRAIDRGLAAPDSLSDTRRAVAADIFYRPGGATARSIRHLYEAIDLDPAPASIAQELPCRP
ncbi:MAG TPA: CDP-glycerol glycerophosphotransferase family protein [Vicinamibacterales bacterium]|nr:CDP-glycerol glycerophosphotransferase family protein [Vicinamibacterales bacterium]